MWKRFGSGVLLSILFLGSAVDLGSVTDESFDPKNSASLADYKPTALDSLIMAYDEYLQHAVDSLKSPGAAVALVYKGEVVLLRGYGVKQYGSNDSVNSNTAFRIGSVSKGFASVLTGIMVEEGYLDWNDRVKRYLTDFRMRDTASASQITVKHILSQTTGFPNHTFTDMLDNGYNYENIKPSLSGVPLAARPGQIYTYQNVVYSLIGDILEKSTGKDYNNLLHDKIFVPLNMNEASTDFKSFCNNANTALPHLRAGANWKAKSKNDRYYSASPASGINASASDMAQWLLALTGYYPEVVPENAIREISTACIETPKKSAYHRNWKSLEKTCYGLGWRIFTTGNHNIVYHGGYVEGFRAEIAFDPETKIGIAVMFNANTPMASQCIPRFFDMVMTKIPAAQPVKYAVN